MDHVSVDSTEALLANGAESLDTRAACDSTDGGSVDRIPIARIPRKTSAKERQEVGWVVVAGSRFRFTYFHRCHLIHSNVFLSCFYMSGVTT